MKGIIPIAFSAVFLVAVLMGLILIYATSEAKPLPNDPIYTNTNSSVNQSTQFVVGFIPIGVSVLGVFPYILILLFVIGVMAFAIAAIRRKNV